MPDHSNYVSKETLKKGEILRSSNGLYFVTLNNDCLIEINFGYEKSQKIIAKIGNARKVNCHLVMQADNNLVIYPDSSNDALWSSNTSHQTSKQSTLIIQDDGNLVVYLGSVKLGNATWASGTNDSLDKNSSAYKKAENIARACIGYGPKKNNVAESDEAEKATVVTRTQIICDGVVLSSVLGLGVKARINYVKKRNISLDKEESVKEITEEVNEFNRDFHRNIETDKLPADYKYKNIQSIVDRLDEVSPKVQVVYMEINGKENVFLKWPGLVNNKAPGIGQMKGHVSMGDIEESFDDDGIAKDIKEYLLENKSKILSDRHRFVEELSNDIFKHKNQSEISNVDYENGKYTFNLTDENGETKRFELEGLDNSSFRPGLEEDGFIEEDDFIQENTDPLMSVKDTDDDNQYQYDSAGDGNYKIDDSISKNNKFGNIVDESVKDFGEIK